MQCEILSLLCFLSIFHSRIQPNTLLPVITRYKFLEAPFTRAQPLRVAAILLVSFNNDIPSNVTLGKLVP